MNTKLIALILFSLLTQFGCKKDDNPSSSSNPSTTNHIYPLSIGNNWIYSIGDTITIRNTSVINGKTAFQIPNTEQDDYTFGERILYYEGSILYGGEASDTVAKKLFDESLLDTLPTEKITVPAGTFDTFKYSYSSSTTYWLARGYGLIRVVSGKGDIQLLKYNIN